MKHFYRIDVHDFYSRNVFFAFNAVSEPIMSEIGISNQQFLYKLFLCKEQQLILLAYEVFFIKKTCVTGTLYCTTRKSIKQMLI